jgi:hypothetical protein
MEKSGSLRQRLARIFLAVLVVVPVIAAATAPANIVIILADDLG